MVASFRANEFYNLGLDEVVEFDQHASSYSDVLLRWRNYYPGLESLAVVSSEADRDVGWVGIRSCREDNGAFRIDN